MIFVAEQAVLTRCYRGVAGLAEFFFHRTETGNEILRIALLVALQIGPALLKVMAGQAAATVQDAEMRLMDEIREASLLRLEPGRGKVDQPPSALDIIDAMAFRA
jgi:hypothetical protein